MQLPAYNGNALLDFSGLNQGVDKLGNAFQRWHENDVNALIGNAMAGGNYDNAAKVAAQQGRLDQSLALDGRADQRRSNAASQQDAMLKRSLGEVQFVLGMKDPARRQAAEAAMYKRYPQLQGQDLEMVMAQARGYQDPTKLEHDRLVNQSLQQGMSIEQQRLALDQQKAAGGGAANEFGLLPVYGKDANGNTVIMQMGKNGKPNLVQLPNGVMVDPGQIAQDKAAGRAMGDIQGKAAASISSVDSDVERMGKQIDDLLAAPGLNNAVGPLQSRMPTFWGSTANAEARIEQIKGGAFLQAIPQMTGMGALSNVEGATATAAIARLNLAQDDEGFRLALGELKQVFDSARARVRAKAGPYAPKDQSQPPALEQLDQNVPQISSEAQYQALPSGSHYIDPNGVNRVKN